MPTLLSDFSTTLFAGFPSLIAIFIFAYLYLCYRKKHLFLWLFSCFAHTFRIKFLTMVPLNLPSDFWQIYQFTCIISIILDLYTTNTLLKIKNKKSWLYFFFTYITFLILTSIFNFPFYTILTISYIALSFSSTRNGYMFLKHLPKSIHAKNIAAFSFIASGLLFFISAILCIIEINQKLFLLVEVFLRILIIIGLLSVFLEKNNYDLTSEKIRYQRLTENLPDTICRFHIHPNFRIDYISLAILKLTGYPPKEFYDNPHLIYSIIYHEDHHIFKVLKKQPSTFCSNHNPPKQYRIIHKSGKFIWVEQTFSPFFDNNNNIIGFESLIRDISLKRSLDKEMLHLNNMKIIGQMATEVADRVRNPLTTISGYLQLFYIKPEFEKQRSKLRLALNEIESCNKFIQQYLLLSKQKNLELTKSNLNDIIIDIQSILNTKACNLDGSRRINIHLNLNPLPDQMLDISQIKQLLINLATNAFDAMPYTGTLTIITLATPNSVILTIQDEGFGIPEEILKNIGQPFFTTKEMNSGLGLCICYNIVNLHQAEINVVSTPTGTTFEITFPL